MEGKIVAVCTSETKGIRKSNVGEGVLKENHGLVGDAHAGDGHRQISLLALESIKKMQDMGLDVEPGDFGENIVTENLNLHSLPVGAKIRVGEEILMEITQIGKECHTRCAIYYQAGDCVMPREGIFALVLKGGKISAGNTIKCLA